MFLMGHFLSGEKETESADMVYQAERCGIEQMRSKRQPCHDDAEPQQFPQEQPFQQYF
jgi:hypothetical protein